MTNRKITRAVRLALVTSGALGGGLYATTGVTQDDPLNEVIIVTGSRIPQPNIEGSSPVTVVGAVDVKVQGTTQVEDLVNNLPQVFADQGGNISNGATGTASVNLRNAGADRTLVLVNGRRLPAGSPRSTPPDLNQIPAPLIERVEVLTGGAGAIYGSDAVAGVVNFIMKDNFEGVQFDLNYNYNMHSNSNSVADVVAARGFALPRSSKNDGSGYEASVLLGSNFADGRGNATIFLGYREVKALLQSERDYSACALASAATEPTQPPGVPTASVFVCGGSGTNAIGRITSVRPGADPIFTNADSSGTARPYNGATDAYNYGPLNYYQRPGERYSIATFAHYDVNDAAEFYTELMFHDDHTVGQIAPSGMFGAFTTISCGNPLFSVSWFNALCGSQGLTAADRTTVVVQRRNIEGGGRQDDIRHTSYRGVFGLRGTIADNWNYDLSGQYGTVVYQETYKNEFSITRSLRALDVVDDGEGNAVCQSVLDGSDPLCVPYDVWRIGGVTQDQLDYVQMPGFQKGDTEQTVFTGTIGSDLGEYGLKLPTASSGVSAVFGVEYREEKLQLDTDVAFTTGDLFGQGGPTIGVKGKFNVTDLFFETRVPLVEDQTGIQELTLNGSYRYSDYSTGATSDTYGIGLVWAPIDDIKLRGGYQQAVRAPNVVELFSARALGLYDNDADPCAGAMPIATAAQCANTGVTAAQYGTIQDSPAGQYNALFGGNPTLRPETAKGWSAGIVWQPSFVEGLSVTVDYSTGEIEDGVGVVPPTTTLDNCLATGNSTFCSLITRDQLGTLWLLPEAQIVATNLNLSTLESTWIDLALDYTREIGSYGSLTFNFVGTILDEFLFEPLPGQDIPSTAVNEGKYDCAGFYGSGTCGTPLPEWRHKLRATWVTPWNVDLSLSWRHFSEVKFERMSSHPLLSGPLNSVDAKLPAQNYLDLHAAWTFLENYTLGLGVNNLTDEDPPISSQVGAGFGNGNTFPQVYDAFGRYVFMTMTAKF